MNSTFRILTVRGIGIDVHASWLVVYALITWTLAAGYFPRVLPDLPASIYWLSGLAAALLLFVSVLLHELSHAFAALRQGLPVRGITLFMFGGVSHLGGEPRSARSEFLIAVVGPLTSFAIAGVLWTVRALGGVPDGIGEAIVEYLLLVNVAVGLFNLVPGFPLDGGRLLRAALWRWKGNLGQATHLASRAGVAFAFGLIALGVLQIFTGSFVGGVWLVLIGLFLRNSADASYAQTALREALAGLTVRDVMTRNVVTVPEDASVAQLVDRFWSQHVTSFPVMAGDTVRGIASVRELGGVSPDAPASTRVRDIMRELRPELVARPGESALHALERASGNGLGRLVVLEGNDLVGYLSLKDLVHVLALRGFPMRGAGGDRIEAPSIGRAA
jgi:Zn-dependent protease/CBS domain-containing protein